MLNYFINHPLVCRDFAEILLSWNIFSCKIFFTVRPGTRGSYLCYLFEMFIAFQVQSVRHRRFYQKIMTNWIPRVLQPVFIFPTLNISSEKSSLNLSSLVFLKSHDLFYNECLAWQFINQIQPINSQISQLNVLIFISKLKYEDMIDKIRDLSLRVSHWLG